MKNRLKILAVYFLIGCGVVKNVHEHDIDPRLIYVLCGNPADARPFIAEVNYDNLLTCGSITCDEVKEIDQWVSARVNDCGIRYKITWLNGDKIHVEARVNWGGNQTMKYILWLQKLNRDDGVHYSLIKMCP